MPRPSQLSLCLQCIVGYTTDAYWYLQAAVLQVHALRSCQTIILISLTLLAVLQYFLRSVVLRLSDDQSSATPVAHPTPLRSMVAHSAG